MFLILLFSVDLFLRDDSGITYKVTCSHWISSANKHNNSANKPIYDNNAVLNYTTVHLLDAHLIEVGKIISYSHRCLHNIKK